MTSALRGGGRVGSKTYNSTGRLRDWDIEGGQNPKFLRTLYVNGPLEGEEGGREGGKVLE